MNKRTTTETILIALCSGILGAIITVVGIHLNTKFQIDTENRLLIQRQMIQQYQETNTSLLNLQLTYSDGVYPATLWIVYKAVESLNTEYQPRFYMVFTDNQPIEKLFEDKYWMYYGDYRASWTKLRTLTDTNQYWFTEHEVKVSSDKLLDWLSSHPYIPITPIENVERMLRPYIDSWIANPSTAANYHEVLIDVFNKCVENNLKPLDDVQELGNSLSKAMAAEIAK